MTASVERSAAGVKLTGPGIIGETGKIADLQERTGEGTSW
jgi:hypothetical protein